MNEFDSQVFMFDSNTSCLAIVVLPERSRLQFGKLRAYWHAAMEGSCHFLSPLQYCAKPQLGLSSKAHRISETGRGLKTLSKCTSPNQNASNRK